LKLLPAFLLLPSDIMAAPMPLFTSKLVDVHTPGMAVEVDVALAGAKEMYLVVTDGGNGISADWADWAEPRLIMADGGEKKLTEIEWKSATAGWQRPHVNANSTRQDLRSNGKAQE